MTDPIADLLTRIRNGVQNRSRGVSLPYSKTKMNVLKVLKANGYIVDYLSEMKGTKPIIRVELKYGPEGEQIIQHIQRVSKPGRRVYCGAKEIKEPLNGLGIAVVSTSRGIVSHAEAKKLNVGGEVLCEVW